MALALPGSHRPAGVRRLPCAVDLCFRAVVWLAWLRACLLVHVQVEGRTVRDLLPRDCVGSAWRLLANSARLWVNRVWTANLHYQSTTRQRFTRTIAASTRLDR